MASFDDGSNTRRPRIAQEVAQRSLALVLVVKHAQGTPSGELKDWCTQHKVQDYLSAHERAFYATTMPTAKMCGAMSCRAEALVPLVWALNGIEDLPNPAEWFMIMQTRFVQEATEHPSAFLAAAKLRPNDELIDAEEEYFEYRLQIKDACLSEAPLPAGLAPGLVFERYYSLAWLIGAGDNWDNVPVDW